MERRPPNTIGLGGTHLAAPGTGKSRSNSRSSSRSRSGSKGRRRSKRNKETPQQQAPNIMPIGELEEEKV